MDVEVKRNVDDERNEGLCEGNTEIGMVSDEDVCGVSCTLKRNRKRSIVTREISVKDKF